MMHKFVTYALNTNKDNTYRHLDTGCLSPSAD